MDARLLDPGRKSDPPRTGGCLALLLFVLAAGCFLDFSEGWQEDEELCGLRVKWNGQGDQANLCREVELCRSALGFEIAGLPGVEFVDDLLPHCLRHHVAGCYTMDFDHIYLAHRDRIAETALCHELLHRELFLASGGDPDYRHASPLWRLIP